MRKPKIYLDTSVISHLKQDDVPEKMADTLKLWEDIKKDTYDVYLSQLTLEEVNDCYEPKRTLLIGYLSDIGYTVIELSHEIETLADKIIEQGILTKKSRDDCIHIASAVINECDIILSWNFKHMVTIKTINGVRAVNLLNGYRSIDIYSPNILVKGDD